MLYRNIRSLFWDPHKAYKYTVWAECTIFMLNLEVRQVTTSIKWYTW